MEEEIIDLPALFGAIKRKWYLIVIISVITSVIGAFIGIYMVKPSYETSTKLYVGKEKGDIGYNKEDVEMYQKLTGTYAEAIQTKDLLKKVVANCNLDITAAEIKSNLKVTAVEDTQIIRIEYSSKNSELVQKIVDGIVDEFSILSQEMVPNVTIKVIETAEAPMQTAENGGKVYIAIGFMFGFMVSLGIIFILDYMDTTLRTKEQIEKEFKINVIGEIQHTDFNRR